MTVTQDLSILSLILNASWAVQAIMVLLLFVSLMSWYYIFRKMFSIRQTRRRLSCCSTPMPAIRWVAESP